MNTGFLQPAKYKKIRRFAPDFYARTACGGKRSSPLFVVAVWRRAVITRSPACCTALCPRRLRREAQFTTVRGGGVAQGGNHPVTRLLHGVL